MKTGSSRPLGGARRGPRTDAPTSRAQVLAELRAEQQRCADLIAAVPGVVWEASGPPDSPTQRIDFVSDHVTVLLGYSVAEWLAQPNFWLTIVHPDDHARAATEAARHYNTGTGPASSCFRWIAKDGRVLWVEARAVTVRDQAGAPVGMRGITYDITARMESEQQLVWQQEQRQRQAEARTQALRESESRHRQLVYTAPDAMVVTDRHGRIALVNAKAEVLFGYAHLELSGQPIEVLFPEGARISRAEVERRFGDGSATRDTAITRELVGLRRDGTSFPVEIRLSPLRTAGEQLVSATVRDLTERNRAQEQHERLIREQARRVEAEAAGRRFAFLAEAGAALNSSLDYRTTLGNVVRLLVPAMADLCAVHLLQPDGTLMAVEFASSDPRSVAWDDRRPAPVPDSPDASDGLWSVVRTCRSQLHAEVADAVLLQHASSPEVLQRLRSAGIRSGLAVPLPARGVGLGTLSLISCTPGRTYNTQDLAMAEEVGRLCGVAVEHTRLFAEAQRELAERRCAEERLRVQSRQQAVVTELGHLALADGGLEPLLDATVRALATTLSLDVVVIAEVAPGRQDLVSRASFGGPWPEAFIGRSPAVAAYTLATGETVLVDDFRSETRLRPMPELREHGIVSAMCAPIIGGGRQQGIVYGMARTRRQFGPDERNFVEAVANVIAGAWARAQAAAALEAEKERLAVTLRSIGDGVIATDIDGRVVLLNAVAETMTGWAQAEAVGRPVEDVFRLVHGRTRAPLVNPVSRALSTRHAVGPTNYSRLLALDGTERLVAESAAPIRDAEGRTLGVVLVFRDETEKERIDAELQRSGTLESLGVFAGGIAHDFNNILTGILANLSLARLRPGNAEKNQSLLAEAERATLRARELTQQLLTFAKGGTPIRKQASIEEIVRESASFVLSGSSVRPCFDTETPIWTVEVDPGQMSQVVQNLVINAQQAMPAGGRVDLVLRNILLADPVVPLDPGPYVRIDVVDTGDGIAPEHLSQVFLPFFTTRRRGSGLGLATAYSIVKKHDGHITVASVLGEGTRFSVYLPASEAPPGRPADPTGLAPVGGSGRVLVMDDEEIVRSTLGMLLQALGYQVTETEDGDQAIDAWRRAMAEGDPYACVIMDLTVPGGMGGLPAIREILAIDPAARGIVSSGYSENPVMSDYSTYGFTDVLTKPYTLGEIAEVLGRVVPLRTPPG
jgi:PAS domain S-box-containing protein